MALPEPTGYLDNTLGYIVPANAASAWSDLSGTTWDSYKSWTSAPTDPLVWVTNLADLGDIIDFNIIIEATYTGTIAYDIYVSTTGEFQGEETITSIAEGDENIPSFYGRYIIIVAYVYKSNTLNTLQSLTFTSQRAPVELLYPDIDTSTLSGTANGRILSLGRTVSKILTLQVIGRNPIDDGYYAEEYFVNGYVDLDYVSDTSNLYVNTDYFSDDLGYVGLSISTMSWPFVVSKSVSAPKICIRDQYGDYIDGTVDVIIKALPEQYMSNGQLLTR